MLGSSTNAYPHSDLERALKGISEVGFRYVEITAIPGYNEHLVPERMTEADYAELKNTLARYHLQTICISGHVILPLAGTDLTQPDAKAIELTKNRIDLTARLGAEVLSTMAGNPANERERQTLCENLRLVGDYGKSKGVTVTLETHGGMMATGQKALSIVKMIDHDYVGINYDTGNVRFYAGTNPEEDLTTIMPYVKHIHLKDHRGSVGDYDFPALGQGEINWQKVFAVLDRHSYRGPFSAEIELRGPKVNIPEPEIDEAQKSSYEFLRLFDLQ